MDNRLAALRRRNRIALAGVVVGVGFAAMIPYCYRTVVGTKIDSDKALTGSQIQRGMYMNHASKDVGPDPNYDFKTGSYTGYRAPSAQDGNKK